jgi:hypothetical protein
VIINISKAASQVTVLARLRIVLSLPLSRKCASGVVLWCQMMTNNAVTCAALINFYSLPMQQRKMDSIQTTRSLRASTIKFF